VEEGAGKLSCNDFTDVHLTDPAPEWVAIESVAISQQPSRCRVVRKDFDHLLRRPLRRWMLSDVEVDDQPAVVRQQDEHEQHSAGEVGTVKNIETVDAT
jgi:hypothetical protein